MLASAAESGSLVRDVLLRDGSTLRLQAPTPLDFDDIKAFFDGLSPECYLRVHGFVRIDTAARAAAEAGGVDRVALIARHDGPVVAVAGLDGCASRVPLKSRLRWETISGAAERERGCSSSLRRSRRSVGSTGSMRKWCSAMRRCWGCSRALASRCGARGLCGELTVSLDITPTEAVQERIDERDHFAAVASLRPICSAACAIGDRVVEGRIRASQEVAVPPSSA